MLKSIGQEAEDPESATSLPRRFYEQANEQIMASKAQNGSYTAQDATAALQLVSFSLFVGGVRGWENALQIAGDWYEKTGVVGSDNPLRAMWELNLTAKFASRLTVWFDIFSSITLQRPARFISTYRKLLRQDDGSRISPQTFWRKDLNMQSTMGCPDAVLLAIAETAELAHWKDQEKKQGSLSYRELNRRAELIEESLRMCKEELALEDARAVLANSVMPATPFFGNPYANMSVNTGLLNTATSAPGTPSSTSGESVVSIVHATPPNGSIPLQLPIDPSLDLPVQQLAQAIDLGPPSADFLSTFSNIAPMNNNSPAMTTASSSKSSTARMSPFSEPVLPAGLSEGDIRRRAGKIFLEGASLYLHTIVSDSNPNVIEVVEGVRAVMESAYALPPSDVDKSLVFPFFIAGVMAESAEQREFFKARLIAHRSIGNCVEAVKLMEAVWKRREDVGRIAAAQGIPSPKQRVHWRDVMEDLGIKLLLI
ncbi:hypothetical protein CPB86DRAFT_277886 [Serendipita vermifera]|nr:hypothetical protein CPB86DRAFT_277886 [Serendipita vermifera]